jgi:D-sedoheptulose 7-phosphate isomerase
MNDSHRGLAGLRKAHDYFQRVGSLLAAMQVTDAAGGLLATDAATEAVVGRILEVARTAHKVILVGNGGSAAIAGHMEMDLCNAVGVRAHVFNDPPVLTALANDHGFDQAFERMVRLWAEPGDCLIAISSSGRSPNIHRAVGVARSVGSTIVTFSGFKPDNALRAMGDFNFYVASEHYGEVEAAHHMLGHFLTDNAAQAAAVARRR